MRISDWSSDVCSSDLQRVDVGKTHVVGAGGDALQRTGRALAGVDGDVEAGGLVIALLQGIEERRGRTLDHPVERSEEHTSELQSLMRFSYAVFCLNKKTVSSYTSSLQLLHACE